MTVFAGLFFCLFVFCFCFFTLWSAFFFFTHSHFSTFLTSQINTDPHAQVPGGAVVNHPSGSQVNLPGCQMCRSGVKSPHYRPKAKPRKWMRLSLSLFPVPHDPLTLLCALRILGWDNRPTFNQLHPHNPSFLQATKLLPSRNALMHPTPSSALLAPSFFNPFQEPWGSRERRRIW